LRQVISEVVGPSSVTQEGLLADLIEGAMALAVNSYVQSRDHEIRRAQAEHGAFVTHELRNPLTTALVTVSHLRKNAERPVSPERLRLLERSLLRLRSLIDSVLAADRLDLDDIPVERELVTLGEVVDEALVTAHLMARDRGLVIEVRVDPDLLLHVDRNLSVSAIQNLVENSLTVTENGPVRLRSEDRPDEVLLHVHDNCNGISREELAIIFEPFRRGHPGRPSAGFGLAVARRAIQAQGGGIGVESEANHGCHFWLTFKKAHN
jgi:signal transduction histidine kinase